MKIEIAVFSAIALAFMPILSGETPSKDENPSQDEITSAVKREVEANNIGIVAVYQRAEWEMTDWTVKITSIDAPETITVDDADRGRVETKVWPVHVDVFLKFKEDPNGEQHPEDVWVYRSSAGKLVVTDEKPKSNASADSSPQW
jgi:hypothetical protein